MPIGIYIRTEKYKKKVGERMIGNTNGFKKGNQFRFQKGHKIRPNTHGPKFHTKETKEKIRQARLKQILPTTDTSIELKVKNYLEKKKIKYIHPFNLGNRFQCDFYLPLSNLIVECDGLYWHSREDMKKRDKAKDAYAKKCGFNMLRLTESEINQGQFILKIQRGKAISVLKENILIKTLVPFIKRS